VHTNYWSCTHFKSSATLFSLKQFAWDDLLLYVLGVADIASHYFVGQCSILDLLAFKIHHWYIWSDSMISPSCDYASQERVLGLVMTPSPINN
jgi:hypothetical protein